jgi:hypothetical protein
MRTADIPHRQIITKQQRRVDLRVQIRDADGTLQSMRDFFSQDFQIACDFGDSIDSECSDAVIKLFRANHDFSLAPLAEASILNFNAAGSYDPLLFLTREVVISARYAAGENAAALDWIEMFRGYIDDIDWASQEIVINCRDKFSRLQDTWIEEETIYSDPDTPEVLEVVLQEIIDDWVASPPTLEVPVTPSYLIGDFVATKQSVAKQLILLVDQIGWRIKYLWDEGASEFQLKLVEPQRTKTSSDFTFGQADYYDITQLGVNIAGVRNAITIFYPDASDLDSEGTPISKPVTSESPTSIALYGRRWMGITEKATSIIDTDAEAEAMADAIVNDLKFPIMEKIVTMPFFAFVELDDLYTFNANDVHYSEDQSFSVIGYRHFFSETEIRTELRMKEGSPIGRFATWYDLSAAPGNGPLQEDLIPGIGDVTYTPTYAGGILNWTNNVPNGSKTNKNVESNLTYEVYVTIPGGIPSATDLIGVTKSHTFQFNARTDNLIPVNEELDFHVRVRTKTGASAVSTVPNVLCLPVGTAGMNRYSTAFVDGMHFNFNEQTKGTNYPPDGWAMETGAWATDANLDDGTTFGGGVTPQYGTKFLILL